MESLVLTAGQRVLDIGSGGGTATIRAAKEVGPSGHAVGVDLSEPLTALARRRAADAGVANVSFVIADMQTTDLVHQPFDLAFSKFGVMFFDEPVAAFSNIRRHLVSGGRLVFMCWQPVGRNLWHTGVALAPFVPAPPPPAPGKAAPGPFCLGDPDYTGGLLTDAGFSDIEHIDQDLYYEGTLAAVFDPSLLDYYGVNPSDQEVAAQAVLAQLRQFRTDDGTYTFPLAVSIYSAKA
jgi:SAM-dependent methyltransferase